jgi:hypothetical protein
MLNTTELRSTFDRLLLELPESLRSDVTIRYDHYSPLHGLIDVVITRGDQCMALGRFRSVSKDTPSGFSDRFRMAMGYPADTWYLFDFDGTHLVINDLSLTDPEDEFSSSAETGFRRLCSTPEEWKQEQKTFDDMKRFLDAMRYLIDEEAITNHVK